MNYSQIIKLAKQGKTIMLPDWKGYFKWNYVTKSLEFLNGDYYLNNSDLNRFKLNKRNDWYYII